MEEQKGAEFKFGFLMLRTRRGLSLLDRFGKFRITRPIAWLMLYLMPVAGGLALFFILQLVAIYFTPRSGEFISYMRSITPLANLLLPGINPYIPIVYGWIAVVTAVVIHEAAHGIVARSLGLPVKSAGVLFLLIIPVGAFVEVDDARLRESRTRDSTRVLAAGAGINFVVGLVCIALLIISVSAMVPAVRGAAIVSVVSDTSQQHSPAYLAGIRPGDFVTAIDNVPVTDLSVIRNGTYLPGESVNLTIWRNGQTTVRNLTLGEVTYLNSQTNQTITYPFIGVNQMTYQDLRGTVNAYSSLYSSSPLAYLALIPSFPRFQQQIPFSDTLIGFYTSPLGGATAAVLDLLYWMFFVNFNLAIFNALPIYPMDGGQAFESFLRGAGRGRISDEVARKVTAGVTLVVFLALFASIAGPYIVGAFP